jgi:hypothetical protein
MLGVARRELAEAAGVEVVVVTTSDDPSRMEVARSASRSAIKEETCLRAP